MRRRVALAIVALGAACAAIIVQAASARPAAIGRFPVAIAVEQQSGHAFVANYGSGTISVLDAGTGAVVRTMRVAPGPLALAVDERKAHVLVASQGMPGHAGSLAILDAQGTVLHTTPVGRAPAAVAVDEEAGHAFVLNLDSSTVSMLDTADGQLIRTVPVALAPGGYSENPICRGLNEVIACYSYATAERQVTLNAGASLVARQSPQGLVVDARRHHLFVVVTTSGRVIELDTRTGALLHTIRVGKAPCALVVDPASGDAYVTNLDSDSVSVLNARHGTVRATIAVGQAPGPIALDQRTGQIIVDNIGDGTLSLIDRRRDVVTRTIGVGNTPNALAVDQRSGNVVVATLSADSGAIDMLRQPARLSVWDPRRGVMTGAITVHNGPEALAIDARLGRAILVSAEQITGSAVAPDPAWLQWLRGWLPFLPLPRHEPPGARGSASILDITH